MDEILTTQIEAPAESAVDEVSMDETIADEWKRISSGNNTERDASGRFAGKQAEESAEVPVEEAPEESPEEATEAPEDADEPVNEAIKAPSSWTKAAQEKFASADPVVQAEILKREADMHNGIAQYKQAAEKAQSFERAFAPYMDTINKIGIAPEVAVSELMKADHSLRYGSPADKVAMVQKIITDYGINPEWFNAQNLPQANPQVDYLQQRLQAIEAQQAKVLQEAQTRESATLNSEIQAFAKNNEHFEQVRDRMADLLQGGAAKTMQEAYEMAIWADPTVRASLLAKQQADERSKAAAKAKAAKQTAAVNVPRRGHLPVQPAVGTIEDTIRASAKELGMF